VCDSILGKGKILFVKTYGPHYISVMGNGDPIFNVKETEELNQTLYILCRGKNASHAYNSWILLGHSDKFTLLLSYRS